MSAFAAGPEHPGALATQSELAYSVGQAGDAAAARDQFAALLPVAERILGPDHPDTLAARASLAYWTGQAGDAAAARDQFAALLPSPSEVLGPEHPDTLINRHNLANFAGYAGDAAAARDQFAALLRVRERVFGAESPDTLVARFNLAYWTGRAGAAAAARDQFAALLPDPRAHVWPGPPRHPGGAGGTRVLDGMRRGPGRRPGPVRRAAARPTSGSSAPSTPRPWPSGTSLPTGPRWPATRPPRRTNRGLPSDTDGCMRIGWLRPSATGTTKARTWRGR